MKTLRTYPLSGAICVMALIYPNAVQAGTATWALNGNGNWTTKTNWNPNTTYPNGPADWAIFPSAVLGGGDRTVSVNADVRVQRIYLYGGGSHGWTIAGPKSVAMTSTVTQIIHQEDSAGSSATISAPVIINGNTLIVSNEGRLTFSGNVTAASGKNPIVNMTSTGADYLQTNQWVTLSGVNNFNTGEIQVSGIPGLNLGRAEATGGAPIRFNDGVNRATLHLNATGNANYASNITAAGAGGGRIILWQGNASEADATNVSAVGSITVVANFSLNVGTRERNAKLSINSGKVLNIQAGGLFLSLPDRVDSDYSQNIYLESGAKLAGVGTLATDAAGSALNRPVTLKSGAILNPGDASVAYSRGTFSVGSPGYASSKLKLLPEAKLQCELSGTTAGNSYDQVAVKATSELTIDGAILEPIIKYPYSAADRVYIIKLDPSATLTGAFAGLPEGATVDLGTHDGQLATAKISYTGDADTGLLTGGNDVVLYDFAGTEGVGDIENWAQPWETTLVNWLKNLQEWEVTIPNQSNSRYNTNQATLEPELRRNHRLVGGSPTAPPLWIADAALSLPADSFLWPQIWRRDRPNTPTELTKRYGVTSGEWWIPSHPTTATLLAWLASWDRSWNALNSADPVEHLTVSRRAAALGIANLIMLYENAWYYYSGEPGARQPAYKWGTGTVGFSLTFSAYAHWKVKDTLPPDVANAWGEGLKWFATKIGNATPEGPENMQLSAPVGIYYTYLGTGDSTLAALAQTHLNTILSTAYSPAGYIKDGGFPDGSYNGIALHRLAEYWSLTQSSNVLQILQAAYDLKQYLTLVEPNGSRIGPSHFNFRCADGYDTDQYAGREVQFLLNVPTAALFVKNTLYWPATVTWQQIKTDIDLRTNQGSSKLSPATAWNSGVISDWQNLLELPYVHYQQTDEAAMHTLVQNAQAPVSSQTNYTKNFNNEFYVIRRPGYAAIFYAGGVPTSDNGATNYKIMLGGDGGYFNGFGGGGLSAFWTSESGATLLGRMNAKEAYQRQTKTIGSNTYLLPGWRDWLNNQVVGETLGGKILSSSRSTPSRMLAADGSNLVVQGSMLKSTVKQGTILPSTTNVTYKRTYVFGETGIDCTVEVNTNETVAMNSLYEALPVRSVSGLTITFKNAGGDVLTESAGRIVGVKTVEISRNSGTTAIIFDTPVNFTMDTVTVPSEQITRVSARSYLVELLPAGHSLQPGSTENPSVKLNYQIVNLTAEPPSEPQAMSTPASVPQRTRARRAHGSREPWELPHRSASEAVLAVSFP